MGLPKPNPLRVATATRIYQNWRYTGDPARPERQRWLAERDGRTLASTSEWGLRQRIDAEYDKLSERFLQGATV